MSSEFAIDLESSNAYVFHETATTSGDTKGGANAAAASGSHSLMVSDGSVYYESKTSVSYVRTASGRFHGQILSINYIFLCIDIYI